MCIYVIGQYQFVVGIDFFVVGWQVLFQYGDFVVFDVDVVLYDVGGCCNGVVVDYQVKVVYLYFF